MLRPLLRRFFPLEIPARFRRPFNRNETEDKSRGTARPADPPITRNDVKSSGDNGSPSSRRCRDTCSLLIGPRRFYPASAPVFATRRGKKSREEEDGEDDEKEEARWQTDGACHG